MMILVFQHEVYSGKNTRTKFKIKRFYGNKVHVGMEKTAALLWKMLLANLGYARKFAKFLGIARRPKLLE